MYIPFFKKEKKCLSRASSWNKIIILPGFLFSSLTLSTHISEGISPCICMEADTHFLAGKLSIILESFWEMGMQAVRAYSAVGECGGVRAGSTGGYSCSWRKLSSVGCRDARSHVGVFTFYSSWRLQHRLPGFLLKECRPPPRLWIYWTDWALAEFSQRHVEEGLLGSIYLSLCSTWLTLFTQQLDSDVFCPSPGL